LKTIAILGSTGSIGTQALEVIRSQPGMFNISLLTSNTNAMLLVRQALEFKPEHVVIADDRFFHVVKEALSQERIRVHSGHEPIAELVKLPEIEIVITGLVGYCGLLPTINAIKTGKRIALANKETMVVAGDLIRELLKSSPSAIIPVDSEHSAIFQCLQGEDRDSVEKLILTASGGPFRGKDRGFLATVSLGQALKHPNWSMGAKITIDSASLMNKGLEIIEARWLFDIDPDQIEVVVHPQSIIHSMVQFRDGSVKAQLSTHDMKLPIQYALGFPERLKNSNPRYDFLKGGSLSFEEPDLETFRNLTLAREAVNMGGNMPCILNAANEVVVAEFLNKRIKFLEMSDVIERCMQEIKYVPVPAYQDYVETDLETRKFAAQLV